MKEDRCLSVPPRQFEKYLGCLKSHGVPAEDLSWVSRPEASKGSVCYVFVCVRVCDRETKVKLGIG